MKLQASIRLVQIFILILALKVDKYECQLRVKNSNQGVNANTSRDNLIWVLDYYGEKNYMMSTEASSNYSTRGFFKVTPEDPSSNTYSVQIADSYLWINHQSLLTLTPTESKRAIFQFIPVGGSEVKFNFFVDGKPLVTPDSSAPYRIFTKTRFPHELAAEFSLIVLNVEESYANKRENILPTLQRIRNTLDFGDKSEAYDELLTQMNLAGHLVGKEIFVVGIYIKEDLGVRNKIFSKLPAQVQTIVSGGFTRISYLNVRDAKLYPFKYTTASDRHRDILPYTFTYSHEKNKWSITYADEHQFLISMVTNYKLSEFLFDIRQHIFDLSLFTGFEHVEILSKDLSEFNRSPLATEDEVPPFRFVDNAPYGTPKALFVVEKY